MKEAKLNCSWCHKVGGISLLSNSSGVYSTCEFCHCDDGFWQSYSEAVKALK